MRLKTAILSASFAILSAVTASAQNSTPRNLILFVPDGLRGRIVTAETAPAMAAVRDKGVNFKNPHSLFPTFTIANASAMATGHYLGDTGTFSNTIYTGYPVEHANGSVTPFLEVDLGAEHGPVWKQKTENYLQLALRPGQESENIHRPFRVLVIANSERRLRAIRAVVSRETEKIFWFADFNTIRNRGFWAPVWLRPKDDTCRPFIKGNIHP